MTTSQRLAAGTLLGGRYRLVEPLPGAARTWRARDEVDDRALLARSIELPDGMPEADRDRARQRALRETAVVARVQHPGVAHVVDVVVENGVSWVVTARPPGRGLGDTVRDRGPVPPAAAALIGLQVLDALGAAGVPHGDLTPADVIVEEDGRVTVTGFATTPVTGTGTPEFQAPEGGPGSTADLWALGVTLHLAVEGRLPGGPATRAGSLRPALDALLDQDPAGRSDPDLVRRLLTEAAGEPAPPAPRSPAVELHDPEVLAALAAFDAAVSSGPIKPAKRPAPGRPAGSATGAGSSPAPAVSPSPGRPPSGRASDPPRPADPAAAATPTPAAPTPGAPTAATPAPAAPATTTPAPAGPGAAASAPAAPVPAAPATTTSAPAAPVGATRTPEGAAAEPAPAAPAVATATPAAPTAAAPPPTAPAPTAPTAAAPAPAAPTAAAPTTAAPTTAAPTANGRPAAPETIPANARPAQRSRPGNAPPAQPSGPETPPRAGTADQPRTATEVKAPAAAETPAQEPRPDVLASGIESPPRPAPGKRLHQRGRRRWLAIALAAALALAAAILLPFLLDRGDDRGHGRAAPAGPTAAGPQPTETASPDTPLPPPAGFHLYRDPAGWSIAVPDGWAASRKDISVTFTQDDRILRITDRPNPPKDPYDAAIARQPLVRAATPGYDFIRIASVPYRGWPTADWEYRAGTTAKTHSVIRSTVPDRGHVFEISWTSLDRAWTADKRFFDTAVQTFDAGA